jgi:erythromycin esterase-like protein
MPTLVTQLTIGDYDKWRPIFDKHQDLRDKAGFKNIQIYRHADNPKEVIVMGEASDVAKAKEGLSSPELMKEWGQFTASDKRICLGVSRQGGADPVYSELLTCLEMARDAREPISKSGAS